MLSMRETSISSHQRLDNFYVDQGFTGNISQLPPSNPTTSKLRSSDLNQAAHKISVGKTTTQFLSAVTFKPFAFCAAALSTIS